VKIFLNSPSPSIYEIKEIHYGDMDVKTFLNSPSPSTTFLFKFLSFLWMIQVRKVALGKLSSEFHREVVFLVHFEMGHRVCF